MARKRATRTQRGAARVLVLQRSRRNDAARLRDIPGRSGLHRRPARRASHLPAQPPAHPGAGGVSLGRLVVLALLVFAAGLGLRDPWPADEPRFVLVARDMVLTGGWLIPRVGGEAYSDKPPLFMWLIAIPHRLGVDLSVAYLLPSLLAALGTLALVYDLARRLWGRQAAWA